jgi:hypothetical protein
MRMKLIRPTGESKRTGDLRLKQQNWTGTLQNFTVIAGGLRISFA